MEAPFVYGRIADDLNFTDRKNEVALLTQNFKNLINTVIISPRRWGKRREQEYTGLSSRYF